MEKQIVIIQRSDQPGPASRIQILSKNIPLTKPLSSYAESVRKHLLHRHEDFQISMNLVEAAHIADDYEKLPKRLLDGACSRKYPFVYDDYDYLNRSVRSVSMRVLVSLLNVRIHFTVEYLTTLEEEERINAILSDILYTQRAYALQTEYEKIRFVYDYITEHVTYDETKKCNSAFNALVDRRSMCEGCSMLLYRMASMLLLQCRIIVGSADEGPHAWNIIRIGNVWYNLDVTWDLKQQQTRRGEYRYFLRGDRNFQNHFRDISFMLPEVKTMFPMSDMDYHDRLIR